MEGQQLGLLGTGRAGGPTPWIALGKPLSFGPQSQCVKSEVRESRPPRGLGACGCPKSCLVRRPQSPFGCHFPLSPCALGSLSVLDGTWPTEHVSNTSVSAGYVIQWPLLVAFTLDPPFSLLGSVCGVLGFGVLSSGCWQMRYCSSYCWGLGWWVLRSECCGKRCWDLD